LEVGWLAGTGLFELEPPHPAKNSSRVQIKITREFNMAAIIQNKRTLFHHFERVGWDRSR
jgi:hypothetical protein